MSHGHSKYSIGLKDQIFEKFNSMLNAGVGTSKRDARQVAADQDKIHSYSTYHSYFKAAKGFANYIKENHPNATTLRAAKKYVNEYLQHRVEHGGKNGQPLSAWTVHLDRAALNKLYNLKPDNPNYFKAPQRLRCDIQRSRGEAVRDKHFSEARNADLVNFCRGTGCRRNVLEKLEGRALTSREDVLKEIQTLKDKGELTKPELRHLEALENGIKFFPGEKYFIHHEGDKGGKERYSPIVGEHKQEIIDRMKATAPNEKVFQSVSKNADIHGYRADYARTVYQMYARPLDRIPYDRINKGSGRAYQSRVYVSRSDESGQRYDKDAMLAASKALGHNRLDVVATNYLH